MKTVTVTTEKELEEVLKNKNVDKIRVEGSLAHKMRSKAKKKKILAGSLLGVSAIALGSIIAAPFTGGASLIAGATAAGLTATIGTATIVVSTAELAILVTKLDLKLKLCYNTRSFRKRGLKHGIRRGRL